MIAAAMRVWALLERIHTRRTRRYLARHRTCCPRPSGAVSTTAPPKPIPEPEIPEQSFRERLQAMFDGQEWGR